MDLYENLTPLTILFSIVHRCCGVSTSKFMNFLLERSLKHYRSMLRLQHAVTRSEVMCCCSDGASCRDKKTLLLKEIKWK